MRHFALKLFNEALNQLDNEVEMCHLRPWISLLAQDVEVGYGFVDKMLELLLVPGLLSFSLHLVRLRYLVCYANSSQVPDLRRTPASPLSNQKSVAKCTLAKSLGSPWTL